MKKLLAACAACMVAGLVSAQVASQIVGYNTVTVEKKWTIVGLNFESVGGGESALNSAVPFATGMTKGAATTTADNIQVQTAAGGYDIYFMCNGFAGKGVVADGDGKWVKSGEGVVTTRTVASGTAFWYLAQNFATPYNMTVAGQVLTTASTDEPITLTWKHIANPYATDLALNNGLPFTTGMTKGAATTTADNIQVQTAAGGYDIYFMSNGFAGKGVVTGGDGKWVKSGEGVVTAAVLPAGKGAWYLRRGVTDFNITVARPFSL